MYYTTSAATCQVPAAFFISPDIDIFLPLCYNTRMGMTHTATVKVSLREAFGGLASRSSATRKEFLFDLLPTIGKEDVYMITYTELFALLSLIAQIVSLCISAAVLGVSVISLCVKIFRDNHEERK